MTAHHVVPPEVAEAWLASVRQATEDPAWREAGRMVAEVADDRGIVVRLPLSEIRAATGVEPKEFGDWAERQGLVRMDSGRMVLQRPGRATNNGGGKPKGSGANRAPRTGLPTSSDGLTQIGHRWRILNSTKVRSNAKLAALVLTDLIGAEANRRGTGYSDTVVECSMQELAKLMGVGQRTAVEASAAAVKAGFFVRVDTGAGGSTKKIAAKYRATLPVYGDDGGR